jgi:predicted MFS family arabinose efflux permease
MAAAMSTAIGPILGGVLTDTVGWRCIFWLNIPVGLIALLMARHYLPESRDGNASHIDVRGQILAVAGLAALTVVLVEGRSMPAGWSALLAVLAGGAIVAFVASQHRAATPMLPLDLFRSRRLNAALTATFSMTFATYGLLLVNSFAFQQQRGASTLFTALCFLPLPFAYLTVIPIANAVAIRIGPRLPMAAGLVLIAAGLFLYAAAGPHAALWLLELSLLLAGAGLALNTGPAVGLAMSATPVQRTGLASGVVNLARLVGITVGVAVLGSAMAAIGGAAGVRAALVIGGTASMLGAVVALQWARAETPVSTKEACHA